MSRVKWKGPYVENDLLKKVKDSELTKKNTIKTMPKNYVILPKFVGFSLRAYNGKTFTTIKIIDEMVGHKLGEFVTTRKQYFYKKKNK